MVLSSGGVFVIYEWPLLIFHLGSSVVIYILQQRGRELDKPRDAPNEPERIIADPIECCLLARWIPLQRTGALMKITAVVGIVRLALNVHSFQGDWLLVVAFRALTSLTLAVVNYYIYKSLTKQLINYTHWRIPEKKLPFILYIIVGCCGIAEVLYAFHCQWTAKKDGYFWLDLSLTFTALMNVALIVHEGECSDCKGHEQCSEMGELFNGNHIAKASCTGILSCIQASAAAYNTSCT